MKVIESGLDDFLWPQQTLASALKLAKEIVQHEHVHIHAMSVGAFTFGNVELAAVNAGLSLTPIKSVIWDSIVYGSEDNIREGIIKSFPGSDFCTVNFNLC